MGRAKQSIELFDFLKSEGHKIQLINIYIKVYMYYNKACMFQSIIEHVKLIQFSSYTI